MKTVDSRAVISHVHETEPQKIGLKPVEVYAGRNTTDWSVLIYAYTSEYSSHRTNKWILSGNGRPVFIAISEQPLKKKEEYHLQIGFMTTHQNWSLVSISLLKFQKERE